VFWEFDCDKQFSARAGKYFLWENLADFTGYLFSNLGGKSFMYPAIEEAQQYRKRTYEPRA
jgi:hypothetical protein